MAPLKIYGIPKSRAVRVIWMAEELAIPYEIMPVTDAIAHLIQPGIHAAAIRETALQKGMRPLRLAGAFKIAAEKTTFAEVLAVVPPAERASTIIPSKI